MSHFRHLIGVGLANNCETYREWAGWTTIASFHVRILSETDTTARFPHFDIILNTSFSPCFTWGRRIKGEKWRHKDRALWGASNDSLYEPCCMTFKCLSYFFIFLGHSQRVLHLALNTGTTQIFSAAADKHLRIWDMWIGHNAHFEELIPLLIPRVHVCATAGHKSAHCELRNGLRLWSSSHANAKCQYVMSVRLSSQSLYFGWVNKKLPSPRFL